MTGASFILIGSSPAGGGEDTTEVLRFFNWALHQGEPIARELDYAPVPRTVIDAATLSLGYAARQFRKAFMDRGPLSQTCHWSIPPTSRTDPTRPDWSGGICSSTGKPPRQVECDAALHWLATPPTPGHAGFVWLHLSLSNAAAERWMRQSLQLADAFYESLHEGVGSTRLEVEGDTLVAVMHDVLFNLSFDAANISTVSVCMDPRLVVTARLRPLRSVDRLRATVKAGQTIRSPAELLAQLLHDQADVLVDIIRQSTARADMRGRQPARQPDRQQPC